MPCRGAGQPPQQLRLVPRMDGAGLLEGELPGFGGMLDVDGLWAIGNHGLDIHFIHLPSAEDLPSGLWAEIALDGRVVYEADLVVTRTLAAVRRRIELVRRSSHGQPYWVEGSTACATLTWPETT